MMAAEHCAYCDRTLQYLLRTFFDIIMLRKGPDSVPASMSVLAFAIGLLLLSFFCSAMLSPDSGSDDLGLSFLVTIASYLLFWLVIAVTGYSHRLVPTISSIMACGSLLTIVQVAVQVFLSPFLSVNLVFIVAWLIQIWKIPVKGHIIARAIGRHWYFGIAIAMTIFVMQYAAYLALIRPAPN